MGIAKSRQGWQTASAKWKQLQRHRHTLTRNRICLPTLREKGNNQQYQMLRTGKPSPHNSSPQPCCNCGRLASHSVLLIASQIGKPPTANLQACKLHKNSTHIRLCKPLKQSLTGAVDNISELAQWQNPKALPNP